MTFLLCDLCTAIRQNHSFPQRFFRAEAQRRRENQAGRFFLVFLCASAPLRETFPRHGFGCGGPRCAFCAFSRPFLCVQSYGLLCKEGETPSIPFVAVAGLTSAASAAAQHCAAALWTWVSYSASWTTGSPGPPN